jgi:hypothetical protein
MGRFSDLAFLRNHTMRTYMYDQKIDSTEKIILDTNSFYDFLGWAGVSFGGTIVPQTNPHIDYSKLNNEFALLLRTDKIALTNVLLFEVISHFRDNQTILYRILKKIQDLHNKEGYKPFTIICPDAFFSLGPSANGKEYFDLLRPSDISVRIADVVKKKIDSEAHLLALFLFMIASAYLISRYASDSKYSPTMFLFQKSLERTDNAQSIVNHFWEEIKDELASSYERCQEKKAFREIFVKELQGCASFLLMQMDSIQDCVNESQIPAFTFSSQQNLKKKVLTKTISQWYFCDKKNPKYLLDFCNEFGDNILNLGYSSVQKEYFRQMLFSIFSTQAKVDKNDAEDFVFLGFIQNKNLLLSFDGQMDDAIKEGSPNNYNYIAQFLSGK